MAQSFLKKVYDSRELDDSIFLCVVSPRLHRKHVKGMRGRAGAYGVAPGCPSDATTNVIYVTIAAVFGLQVWHDPTHIEPR